MAIRRALVHWPHRHDPRVTIRKTLLRPKAHYTRSAVNHETGTKIKIELDLGTQWFPQLQC